MDICDALTNANARKVTHQLLPLADTPSKTYGKRLMQIPWQWFPFGGDEATRVHLSAALSLGALAAGGRNRAAENTLI